MHPSSTMAIKEEVHVKSMVWMPKISLHDGRYVIRPFECKIIGKVEELARVKAIIHTLSTTFDDEEWRIITLFVNHLDSRLKYTDLFAASCGSLGDPTELFMNKSIRLTRRISRSKCTLLGGQDVGTWLQMTCPVVHSVRPTRFPDYMASCLEHDQV